MFRSIVFRSILAGVFGIAIAIPSLAATSET